MALPNQPENPSTTIRRLLDQGYLQQTGRVIDAISNGNATLDRRFADLEKEAARLLENGELLSPDNPYVAALLSEIDTQMKANARLIDGAAAGLQNSGASAGQTLAQQLSLPGNVGASIGIQWNSLSADAMAAAVDFISSPAWSAELSKYTEKSIKRISDLILNGIREGRNPLVIAREVRRIASDFPASYANTLMRTLQLMSYRAGTEASYLANADILQHKIRVATLDSRTCILCVALHGEIVALGDPILAHWNCRCTSVGIVKGRQTNVRSGTDWFNSLSPEMQIEKLGPGGYAAWKAGQFQLGDLVQPYEDPLFGEMIKQKSLEGLLGSAAKDYYQR